MDIRKRMDELIQLINKYNHAYYQENQSLISDQAFDELLQELIQLEQANPLFALPDSPTQRVGGTITKQFKSVTHQFPMLSLGNTYNESELRDFDERVQKGLEGEPYEYICELKFDGVALSFWYENGILQKGVTRGDGTKGDDITANVKTIRSLPLKINDTLLPVQFELRGEGYMPLSSFEAINEEKEKKGSLHWLIHEMRRLVLLKCKIRQRSLAEKWNALFMPFYRTTIRFKRMKKAYSILKN